MMNEPGRCIVTGEVLIPADELAGLLELADNLPDPGEVGRPSTPEELERLARGADSLFAQRTTDEKVLYLNALPTDEAAKKLMRLHPKERTHLLGLLSPDRREAIAESRDYGSLVTRSP